jgi:hypothetical protein
VLLRHYNGAAASISNRTAPARRLQQGSPAAQAGAQQFGTPRGSDSAPAASSSTPMHQCPTPDPVQASGAAAPKDFIFNQCA